MVNLEELRASVKGTVLIGEPMSGHTTFRTGGPADFFLRPDTPEDLCRAVTFFRNRNLPCTILGCGSNMLVHDDGIRGAVIATSTALSGYRIRKDLLTAGAGVSFSLLAAKSFEASLGGIELLQGIPGTLGGAIYMNAGAWGQQIGDAVSSIDIFSAGSVKTLRQADIAFVYRSSGLDGAVILSAELKLRRLTARERREQGRARDEAAERRLRTQPLKWPNAGSVFRNPGPEHNPEGMSAGRMIELCGLKGRTCGGAMISDVHANFIVNTGSATSADVMALVTTAREAVLARFGIELELEVRTAGFENAFC